MSSNKGPMMKSVPLDSLQQLDVVNDGEALSSPSLLSPAPPGGESALATASTAAAADTASNNKSGEGDAKKKTKNGGKKKAKKQKTSPGSSSSSTSAKKKKKKTSNSEKGGEDTAAAGVAATAASPASSNNTNNSEKENGKKKKKGRASTSSSAQKTPKAAVAAAAASPASAAGGSSTKKRHGKTYIDMVHDAIAALNDRTGSSQPLIIKWLQQSPEYMARTANNNFRKLLNQAIKTGVKTNRFAKNKASYKISAKWKEQERSKKRKRKAAAVAAAKKAAAAKKKKKEQQQQEEKKQRTPVTLDEWKVHHAKKMADLVEGKKLSEEELAKEKLKMDRKEESVRKKEEADRKEKERNDRIKKRRFPIEDTRLHAEDEELGEKPPPDVTARPNNLPYFWHLTKPLKDPSRSGRISRSIRENSKVESLNYAGTNGLVPDILQVYHFFRGDVHFTNDSDDDVPIVPDFTLQNLVYAAEQVINGQAKSNRMVPPLIVHLFCTCLHVLFQKPSSPDDGSGNSSSHVAASRRRLQSDLNKYLAPILTPASWADVCFLYMDAMNRFFTTDASRDPSVLRSLNTDVQYLLGRTNNPELPMTPPPTAAKKKMNGSSFGNGGGHGASFGGGKPEDSANAYYGDTNGVLYKAHGKLERHDPWLLSAEDLFALLRSLTDDILAMHPAVGQDIEAREEEMQSLLKAKRAADAKFRKVRLAFEGPKRPVKRASTTTTSNDTDESKEAPADKEKTRPANGDSAKDAPKEKEETKKEEPFKPTATKKQFEAAKKAQQKASDAYEKGIRKLVSRTEPIGYDRYHNAVYCFRHDPEILYVEEMKAGSSVAANLPPDLQFARRSWHVIETKSLFDELTSSLDLRGKREQNLYDELIDGSFRRHLHDDVKEQAEANARLKEKEALKKRLEIAREKCNEEKGRRSGRLAGQAEEELLQVEREIEEMERRIELGQVDGDDIDYEDLTGLTLLRKFDTVGRVETRRSREKKKSTQVNSLQCSKLVSSGNIDGSGLVGMFVKNVLELEERCEALVPLENGIDRSSWIAQLEGAVHSWNSALTPSIGSPATPWNGASAESSRLTASSARQPSTSKRDSLDSTASNASKRRRFESPGSAPSSSQSTQSVASLMAMLKQPLLDLEERVAVMTNLDAAARDADLADDNMSTDSSEADQANRERLERAWKRIVHKIRKTETRRHVQIRELLVSAISAARKAHLPEIVAKLRAALLFHRPNAAWDCKAAAIEVLQANGDYDEEVDDEYSDDDEDEDEDEEEEANEESEEFPSVIPGEAGIIRSSLGGSDDSSREDWVKAVKSTRTISRLASLTEGFIVDAAEKIEKSEVEQAGLVEALAEWEKEQAKETRAAANNKKMKPFKEFAGPSEVWANVRFTDELVMARAEAYPYWPARKCVAKDAAVAESLDKVNRQLVSCVGEMGGLRVVKNDDLKPFTGKIVESDDELTEFTKATRNQLDDCMAMARRVARGLQKSSARKGKSSK